MDKRDKVINLEDYKKRRIENLKNRCKLTLKKALVKYGKKEKE
jgi:hypothetical protein